MSLVEINLDDYVQAVSAVAESRMLFEDWLIDMDNETYKSVSLVSWLMGGHVEGTYSLDVFVYVEHKMVESRPVRVRVSAMSISLAADQLAEAVNERMS
jgi:hypothetical protein